MDCQIHFGPQSWTMQAAYNSESQDQPSPARAQGRSTVTDAVQVHRQFFQRALFASRRP